MLGEFVGISVTPTGDTQPQKPVGVAVFRTARKEKAPELRGLMMERETRFELATLSLGIWLYGFPKSRKPLMFLDNPKNRCGHGRSWAAIAGHIM